MLTQNAYEESRSSFWPRVRQFAVPPSMIETATARREAGDWAGACAAAGVDVDLDLRSVARAHGPDLTARLRADLRHLAPDLLRWHMPRIAPHGLLRPGLTVSLARYDLDGSDGVRPVHLVVRTPPAWADAGQRISLALWDGSRSEPHAHRHPHPRPGPRFRLDLHRHLWDARRADDLRVRSGADLSPSDAGAGGEPAPGTRESVPLEVREPVPPEVREAVPPELRRAIGRWTAEAGILLRAEGRSTGAFAVRLGGRRRLFLELAGGGDATGPSVLRTAPPPPDGDATSLPVLPDAATWVLPDLELLRTGAIDAGLLHPLVARALLPGVRPRPAHRRSWTGRGGPASWSAGEPGTGSAWSTGSWSRWTTTRPRSAGRSCWSP